MYPTLFSTAGVKDFAEAIDAERARQLAKFGDQKHPDGTGTLEQQKYAETARRWCQDAFGAGYGTWADILDEEVAEAKAERDPAKLRAELVQVAAVCAAWIWDLDNRPPASAEHDTQPTSCGKCQQPFDEADIRFRGSRRRFKSTPWCCACVDRCHDNESADHACVICR